jgi:hypothetical protein
MLTASTKPNLGNYVCLRDLDRNIVLQVLIVGDAPRVLTWEGRVYESTTYAYSRVGTTFYYLQTPCQDLKDIIAINPEIQL